MIKQIQAVLAQYANNEISENLCEARISLLVLKARGKTQRLNTDQPLAVRMGTKKKVQRATANNRRAYT